VCSKGEKKTLKEGEGRSKLGGKISTQKERKNSRKVQRRPVKSVRKKGGENLKKTQKTNEKVATHGSPPEWDPRV